MTDDLKIVPSGALALTKDELDMLDAILATGDRGGFYQTYYAMTGSSEANLQSNIATFSGLTGAAAFGANRLDQTAFGPGSSQSPGYKGIYHLSQKVALQAAKQIKDDATNGSGTGNIPDKDFFGTAHDAWVKEDNIAYFPGNALDPSQALTSFQSFLSGLANDENWQSDNAVLSLIRTNANPGALVSMLAVFAALPLGKQASDFAGNPNYDEVTTSGGNLYVNKTTGIVSANFNPDLHDAAAAAVLALITAFFVGTGAVIGEGPGALVGLTAELALQEYIRSIILADWHVMH